MSEELLQKYRDLAKEVSVNFSKEGPFGLDEIIQMAKELLAQDFKEQVIDIWHYDINNCADDFENITKVEFINHFTYLGNQEEFVEKNWNRVSGIISIIKDEIEKRKRAEK